RWAESCTSASTPPPTTCATSSARRDVRIVRRRPRTRTGAISCQAERELEYAGAALRHRTDLRRATRAVLRRRPAHRGRQRRRGCQLAPLVLHRRPAALLLPLR